ncbi:histidine--tRNA ligase [Natronospora cellulosivora (SeqCode)]
MKLNAPRGTNDILPPFSLKWQYIEEVARKVLSNYNYEEIRTPIFEYTELFQRGIGETTDVVEKEMYTFEDKGGRSITLRPEGTASVVRSFMENKLYGLAQPQKFYYIGPMFRYERPQAGRFRQFHQFGVEVFGADDPALDAEVISLGVNYLNRLGLDNLEVYINSIGCPECREEYLNKLKNYLSAHKEGLCYDCTNRFERNALRVLDCKEDSCSKIVHDAPSILDNLCEHCAEHFDLVKSYLDSLEINYIIDDKLVRGLDYYTNTAFEIKYNGLGAQDTVLGGGRYNKLADEIGGKDIPAVGFAMGMERLLLILEEQEVELPIDKDLDLYITTIGDNAKKAAFKYIYQLRNNGFKTEIDYLERSVKGQMKAADRMNATYTIILGQDELDSGKASIKNMKNGEQEEIELKKLLPKMQKIFFDN